MMNFHKCTFLGWILISGLAFGQDAAPSSEDTNPSEGTAPGESLESLPGGDLADESDAEVAGEGGISSLPVSPEFDEQPNENQAESDRKIGELQYLATERFRKRRYPDTIRYINDLITLKPYRPEFHFALALCFRAEGKYPEALKKYQDVLDLGGPKALVAVLKAEVHAKDQNDEKVYEMFKEAALGGRNIIADVRDLKLLESYRQDAEFVRLALQLERFEVQPTKKDPFTRRFERAGQDRDGPKAGPTEPYELTTEQQAELLRNTKKSADKINFFIKLQDEEKAMKAYDDLKKSLGMQNRVTVPRIRKEFDRIQSKLPEIEVQISGIRLKFYYDRANEKLRQMRESFEDGAYVLVEKTYADLEKLAAQMVKTEKKFSPVARQIMARADGWMSRAKVRLEFDSHKPDIQGIIISGGEKMTILDEKIIRQGESLGNFRVVRIETNRVTFRYKGEEIPMVFRRY